VAAFFSSLRLLFGKRAATLFSSLVFGFMPVPVDLKFVNIYFLIPFNMGD